MTRLGSFAVDQDSGCGVQSGVLVSDMPWCWGYVQKYDYKVKMCCPKCEEKVQEEAYEVPGKIARIMTNLACTLHCISVLSVMLLIEPRSFAWFLGHSLGALTLKDYDVVMQACSR